MRPPTTVQLMVLELASFGLAHKEIARQLRLSQSNVSTQLARARAALGADSTAHAMRIGFETGLLERSARRWTS